MNDESIDHRGHALDLVAQAWEVELPTTSARLLAEAQVHATLALVEAVERLVGGLTVSASRSVAR